MSTLQNNRVAMALLVALAIGTVWSPLALAQRGQGPGGGGPGGGGPKDGGLKEGGAGGGGGRPSMGGGGARPSMGSMGGGGTRPSMSEPNMPDRARPTTPNISRPSPSRPSLANTSPRPSAPNMDGNTVGRPSPGGSRPSLGGAGSGLTKPSPSTQDVKPATRPTVPPNGNSPGIGGNRPGSGDRPSLGNANRPTTLPGITNRPTTLPGTGPGTANRPTTLPGTVPGTANRPTTLPGTVPGTANRPTTLPGTVPGTANRPTTLPGTVPGTANRPTTLPGTVPGTADRPTTLPGVGNRPSIGGERPSTLPGIAVPPGNSGNRPGNGNRPVIGGNRPGGINNFPGLGNSNNIVNRPGQGGNRPGIGNDTNINIGNINNNVNIGGNNVYNVGNRYPNRPNWDVDPGYSRPSWGLNGGQHWHDNWHNNCINNHHNWYNGCWQGYWSSSWYAPVVWGGIGWGLGSMTNGWGVNNVAYYNPYYAEPVIAQAIPYDYSQPVVVNNYITSSSDAPRTEVPAEQATLQQEQSLSSFDSGLAKFQAAQYVSALSNFNSALKELPGDAVVHEVRSLALFAIGDYKSAAASLNSLLSSAPGMDWTTMSGLYGNPDDYTAHLRKLEQFCQTNPNDASANFVLAYHYLVTGDKDAAINALQVVVKNQPKDLTAKRMLDAMTPPAEPAVASTPSPLAAEPGLETSQTDLVGKWMAQAQNTTIELSITEDSKFTWKADVKDQAPVVLTGQLDADGDGISLETKEQGSIGGTVVSKGPDEWRFVINGSPATDPGLSFARVQ